MEINWDDNRLTPQIRSKLQNGTKVKFMWHGNSELIYEGRIKMDNYNNPWWIPEQYYINDVLQDNHIEHTLDSFFHFTMFEIVD